MSKSPRRSVVLRGLALTLVAIAIPVALSAQSKTSVKPKPALKPTSSNPVPTTSTKPSTSPTRARTTASAPKTKSTAPRAQGSDVANRFEPAAASSRGAAWSLPDADMLVERVYRRIVAHDKPGAVPIPNYQRRFFGREATLEAVRQFAGHDVELSPSAFNAVEGWTDAPKLDIPPCIGPGCPAPINSIWLAITRIERGELPHELHVWYTTSFAAESPSGPTQQAYAFCERWLRVGGSWKYDGFVRVASVGTRSE
jgi:hypothetical protein